jgi:hypothetical protein
MPPLEEYLEHADELAQEVMKVWGPIVQTGHAADLSAEFKALVHKTCLYRDVRGLADNHREHNVLSEQVAAEEKATRQAFAEAYKAFYEKHAAISWAAILTGR